jgi:glutaredoxin
LFALLFLAVAGVTLFERVSRPDEVTVPAENPAARLVPTLPSSTLAQPTPPRERAPQQPTRAARALDAPTEQPAPTPRVAPRKEPPPARQPTQPTRDEMRVARRQVPITVYATSWCPSCRRAKAYLREEGISFVEHDIDSDPTARARMHQLNPGNTIPTFDIDGTTLTRWSPRSLRTAIDDAALRRWRRHQGLDSVDPGATMNAKPTAR